MEKRTRASPYYTVKFPTGQRDKTMITLQQSLIERLTIEANREGLARRLLTTHAVLLDQALPKAASLKTSTARFNPLDPQVRPDYLEYLTRYYQESIGEILGNEDRAWLQSTNMVCSQIEGKLSSSIIEEAVGMLIKVGFDRAAISIVMGIHSYSALVISTELFEDFTPPSYKTEIASGNLGTLCELPLYSDSFRHPLAKALSNEIFVVAKAAGTLYQDPLELLTAESGQVIGIKDQVSHILAGVSSVIKIVDRYIK